jgi:hypothetical protein
MYAIESLNQYLTIYSEIWTIHYNEGIKIDKSKTGFKLRNLAL